jgi:hypothetical protein
VPNFLFKKNSDKLLAYIGYLAFVEIFQKELEKAHLTLCKISSSFGRGVTKQKVTLIV